MKDNEIHILMRDITNTALIVFDPSFPASQACLLNFSERDLGHGVGMFVIVYVVHISNETV